MVVIIRDILDIHVIVGYVIWYHPCGTHASEVTTHLCFASSNVLSTYLEKVGHSEHDKQSAKLIITPSSSTPSLSLRLSSSVCSTILSSGSISDDR